jgi:hypothetical protein
VYFRLLLPAFAWLTLIFLIVFREYRQESMELFFGFSQSTIFQFVLFLGFGHIWKGVFMKQLKFRQMKEHSDLLVLLLGLILSLFVEVTRWKSGLIISLNYVNLFTNLVGVIAGLGVFRLVYRSSY